ncbi:MAG: DUF3040 domain-containing protein [Actinomycetota bacterium]
MPLSDREQQILQEIEDQLYEQDPEFARGVSSSTLPAVLRRNVRRGILAFVSGLAVLVGFFFYPRLPVGVIAFLVMVAAAYYTYDNLHKIGNEQLRVLREQASLSGLMARIRTKIREAGSRDDQ